MIHRCLGSIGVVLALFAATSSAGEKASSIVADVKAVGGEVQSDAAGLPVVISLYDGNNPLKGKGGLNTTINDVWLARLAGLTTVTTLNLSNCDVHAAGLKHVATMTNLENLGLTLTPVADDDLVPLASLTKLTNLSLASTKCTGTGLKYLAGCQNLSNLNMHFTPVNDAGLAEIAKVGNLERLWIAHGHFSDAAGPSLAAHKHLRRLGLGTKDKTSSGAIVAALAGLSLNELELFDQQADDAGLVNAAKIRTLKLLTASYAPTATDAALEAVAALPALEEFRVGGSKLITDAGIAKLGEIKTLKKLSLSQLKSVSDAAIEKLRAARPDLVIDKK